MTKQGLDVYLHIKDDKITMQSAKYIEEGWYVEIVGRWFTVYTISIFGKIDDFGTFKNIRDAIGCIQNIT